jgi:hypothetical protein
LKIQDGAIGQHSGTEHHHSNGAIDNGFAICPHHGSLDQYNEIK